MSNSYFKFKRFVVEQGDCAMKVGTDGCLLGAWFDVSDSRRILDVGTGSGLIALMAAQRCEKASVIGIEIDEKAATQALCNIERSEWKNRIEIVNEDIKLYNPEELYDTIVSNPPYFSNSMKCDDSQRTLARHNDSLAPEHFFACAKRLLVPHKGKVTVIIPSDLLSLWRDEAGFKGFSACRITHVRTRAHKPAKRSLVEFSNSFIASPCVNELVLEKEQGVYSDEACELLRDFYLKIE